MSLIAILGAVLSSDSLITPLGAAGRDPQSVKRVLLLHQELASRPFRARFNAAFVDAMRSDDAPPVDIYEEAVEAERFGAAQLDLVRAYLTKKYQDHELDVLVAVGARALSFAKENRAIFGDPPIVAVVLPTNMLDADEGITGLQGGGWVDGTIDLAMALRPETDSIYVVDGMRGNDGRVQSEIEHRIAGRSGRLQLRYLRDMPIDDVIASVATAPQSSVVLFVRQTIRDGSYDLDPFEGLSRVTAASPVPIFTNMEEYIGRGVVGGDMWRFEDDARQMAALAKQVTGGIEAGALVPRRATYNTILDWRQLERWKMDASNAPFGSVMLFRPQSVLDPYRRYVAGGFVVLGIQLALIVGLLVQLGRRRRAERDLRDSDRRYRSVVDTQTDLICRFRPDTTLTFVNDAYCIFWNKTPEELLGTRFIDLVPEAYRQDVLQRIRDLASGTESHEHPVLLADGRTGWQHWINHAVLDVRGRVVEFQGVGRDITERKQTEEALHQLQARNGAILKAIPDLMFLMRCDGTYLDYHARDSAGLFAPPEQFIGKTVREVMPPALADLFADALDRACGGADAVLIEYDQDIDGIRSFEARLVAAGTDRVLCIVRDVTEAKNALRAKRALAGRLITSQEAERTRIARDLHDDLGQEVASFSVDVSHLRRQEGDLRSADVQDALLQLQRRAQGVAESIRLLSHGLHPTVLSHVGLVAAVRSHCAEVERQHHLHVRFFSLGVVEPGSRLVALSLFRIAQEALRNAVVHGRARKASVSLVRSDGGLTMVIADDGVGFDVASLHHSGGLGLLSIEERARLVGGEITVNSLPGSGTTISVRVPAGMVDHAQQLE